MHTNVHTNPLCDSLTQLFQLFLIVRNKPTQNKSTIFTTFILFQWPGNGEKRLLAFGGKLEHGFVGGGDNVCKIANYVRGLTGMWARTLTSPWPHKKRIWTLSEESIWKVWYLPLFTYFLSIQETTVAQQLCVLCSCAWCLPPNIHFPFKSHFWEDILSAPNSFKRLGTGCDD